MRTDELDLLRAWAPPDAPASTAEATARARLAAHLAPPSRRARRRWWLAAAPAAAAVATALVVALTSGVQDGTIATPPATAAEALEQAARAAEAAPEPFPRPTQFFYTKTQATWLDCRMGPDPSYCWLTTLRREAWVSLRRDGRERTTVLGYRWPSEEARQRWIAAGRPPLDLGRAGAMVLHHGDAYSLGNERLTYAQMRDFDDSGDALYRRLHDHWITGQGGGRDAEVFTQIGDALREQAAPPKLRAALYRALKHLPGIDFAADTRDRLGRPAVAVSLVTAGVRRELLFDPDTSTMLAERDTIVDTSDHDYGAPVGTVVADAVYERRGVVDALDQRP